MKEWIISSSLLILAVIALRAVFRHRLSLRLQYALWLPVLLRLLIPGSLGSSALSIENYIAEPASATPAAYVGEAETQAADTPEYDFFAPETETENGTVQNVMSTDAPAANYQAALSDGAEAKQSVASEEPEKTEIDRAALLRGVWLGGAALVLLTFAISNLRFGARLRRSRKRVDTDYVNLPVYVCAWLDSPCLFGVFCPAIYIGPELSGESLRHVLTHERTHYRHGDHIWALLRCACLALHWYNPLVWLAAALSKQDSELACDESAIRELGEGERIDYGRTLVSLTAVGSPRLLSAATTMSGSRRSIRERVGLIARAPKTALLSLAVVLLASIVAVGCTFTGASAESRAKAAGILGHMYIEPSANQNAAENLERQKGSYLCNVFDYQVDDTVKSVQINSYELIDGEWSAVYSGLEFTGTEGTVLIGFDIKANGVMLAAQSEVGSTETSYTRQSEGDEEDLLWGIAWEDNRKEISYGEEIPLAVQIYSAGEDIPAWYPLNNFFTPEIYEEQGYEHVYAVTAVFSQMTPGEIEAAAETETAAPTSAPEAVAAAPTEDAPKYGNVMPENASEVMDVIQRARDSGLLDGQDVIFNTDINFRSDTAIEYYCDDTLLVICWKEIIDGNTCSCVEVKAADAAQLGRKLADDTYGSENQYYATELAEQVDAVVAMNADAYQLREPGIVVYDGELYRYDAADYDGYKLYNCIDNCFVTSDGDFLFMRRGEEMTEDELRQYIQDNDIRFSLAFGPILVEDGAVQSCDSYPVGEPTEGYSRAGIGQYDELHYLYMSVNHSEEKEARWTVDDLARHIAEKGIKDAYCLDGGQTGEIVFQGEPYNYIDYGSERLVSDIIYFAAG